MTATAAGQLTTTVLRWLGGSRDLEGEFQCIQLLDGRESRYPLIPRAGCHCSKPVSVPFSVWTNPLTGLVFNFKRTPDPVGGIWHARAEHFRPLPRAGARPLLRPGTVYGAGSSSDEAETRCIAEGLERYSSIWQGDEELLCASKDQLENTIDPEQITLFSEKQYSDRLDWNQKYAALFHVAERLETKEPIEWAKAKALSDGAIWYVPAACVYLWHNTPAGINFGIADSNGCAAGRTQEEAILGGLLELIERDAVAIWWYNRLQRPQVDWAAFGDPWILEAVEAMNRNGRRPVLLDLTHDFGIPVYAAVAAKVDGSHPYAGCAAHLDARTAARKALTELVQNWFWSSLDRGEEAQYAWLKTTHSATNEFFLPKGTAEPGPSFLDSTDKAIELCVRRLAKEGISAFWLDLTRQEIGLPVVRVIAPGLRHCWMRFAPGRLYDVPVRMGWLENPLQEEAMNPEGCPL
jgi:ribosomal protein S12 methylthiotransferase accessory factor